MKGTNGSFTEMFRQSQMPFFLNQKRVNASEHMVNTVLYDRFGRVL